MSKSLYDELADKYKDEPCGKTGLDFPNGLPDPESNVFVRTVWSNGKWEETIFMGKYGWGNQYDWFSVYGKPNVSKGSMPIVLEWKYKHE